MFQGVLAADGHVRVVAEINALSKSGRGLRPRSRRTGRNARTDHPCRGHVRVFAEIIDRVEQGVRIAPFGGAVAKEMASGF